MHIVKFIIRNPRFLIKDIISRNLYHFRIHLIGSQCHISHTDRIDTIRFIYIVFTFLYIGQACAVDHNIRTVDMYKLCNLINLCDIHFLDIRRQQLVFHAFKQIEQCGSDMSLLTGNPYFLHLVPPITFPGFP